WNSITIGTNNDVLNANTTKHFGNILGSGECGENLMWELAKYGDLTISGTGKMYDWNSSESVPWADFSEKITKVTIGEGVTNIGNYAFSNCTNVKSVSIPDTAVSIGTYALSWCESISVVTIPSSVEYIGAKAFTGCASLKKITVESGNTAFVTDGYGVLYNITKDTLICYPAGNTAASYEIPGGTKTIISNAFYGCNILNMIIIPESVTTIEDNAFEYCECISDVYYSGTEEQWNEIDLGLGNEPITGATVHYMYVENVIDSGECGEGLTWELIDAGILIVSGSGNMESWTEENKAPWAKYSSDIKKIIVEDGVASIGSYAFEGLENITDIRLPDSVSSIGSYAFGSCSSLQTVTLGMSVSDISDYAFYGCDSLADVYYASTEEMWSKVTVGTGNDDFNNASFHFSFVDNTVDSGVCGENLTWKVDDEGLLTVSGNGTMTSWTAAAETPWYAHYSTVNRVVIEEGVENIGAYAFCNFTSLKSVDIADSVAIIENSAFNGCIKLDEVVVPMGVTSIGWSAFYNCNTMYKVTFYDNLASIGASAFYKCSLLSDVYYHGNGKQWENIQVDSGNTQLSNAVKHFIVPEAEGECGENLTWKLSADGTLTVSGAGDMASWSASSATPWFEHQSGITKIVIEDGVTSVGEYAFSGLAYLTDVIIADSVTVIGHYAFSGAPLLQSVVLPDELVTLGWLSFYGCSALSHVTFGSKISSVGSSAFNSCSSLKYVYYYGTADGWSKVSVGNNNSYLINATKYYTSNGTTGESGVCGEALSWSVDDNATLTVSGSGAMTSWTAAAETPWYGLRNIINKIVIESGVTNIGDYAFCGFKAMKEADIADTVKTVGNSSFNTCTALETVSLPDGVTSIGWSAYYACYGIESLVLPASITKIGASAFYNCKNLKDVYYAGDQQQWNEIVIGVDNDVLTMETNKHFGNILYSGTYGDNLTWQIDKFGTLAISGSGEVPATDVSGDLPWIKYNTVVSKISINDGITSIGAYAFRDMLVSEISIPSSVTYIAPGAFEQISALAAIYVDAANNAYSLDESGVLYNSDKTSVIKYPSKLIGTEYIIADTAAVIESYAFSDCDSLAKLVIPASVTTISDNAIVGCDNLAEVHYSASKSAWKNVEIGEGNDSLYDAQKFFANPSGECGENLTWELDGGDLTISGTGDMTQWAHESERPWHEYSEEITKVVVMEGVTSVGSFAFKALANMNTVDIASTVAVIGAAAFAECGNLEEITIPNGVETIDDGAFFASGISEFAIPASVTYIGEGAFENCQNLTSIIVDSDNMSYSSDEYGVLFDKDMATLVYCPLNAAITTYSIPETVFAINSKAFAGNENIISITIPDGVNALESMTFMNCNNLEEITIPMSLTHISSQAFEGCASLYTVYCGHTEKAWASVVIEDGNESFVD
ncbi:MAG: leucine-rich repeat domain-containing protein, partial [Clostridia bacterium]|nr:leucine-rich repeat domain-containing protein [Clostridia bacterium]